MAQKTVDIAPVVPTETMIPACPMICSLIQKAMSKIGAIGKDSEATNYNGKKMYNFRGIDAVYNALNPVMAELGLFIIPEVLEQTREERKSTTGGNLIYSILKIKFTMYAPDGSSVSGIVIGEGMDSGDKASNKAMSIAMKYFCFQTFMIPTEELKQFDPDGEVHEVAPRDENPPAQPPVRQSAPADVTTHSKLPEQAQAPNPVLNYLANEKAFIARKIGITDMRKMDAWFIGATNKLIESGAIEPIPAWNQMTRKQAENLVEAIKVTFIDGDAK